MSVIRETDGARSPQILALLIGWQLPLTCQMYGCEKPSNTIVSFPGGHAAICEEHYQQGMREGHLTFGPPEEGGDE